MWCSFCPQAVELCVKASSSAESGDTGTFKVEGGVTVFLKGVNCSRLVVICFHPLKGAITVAMRKGDITRDTGRGPGVGEFGWTGSREGCMQVRNAGQK